MADGDFFGIGGGLLGNGGAGFNPSQLGLLQAGLALMQSRPGENFAGAIGRAGQAGVGGYMQGKEQALQDQYQSERTGLLGAQRSKIEAEQAQRLQQQRYLDSLRTPQMPADAMSGGGGPSNANAQMLGQGRQFDPYQALLAGIPIDQVKALAESGNFGKAKAGNFQTVVGPNGQPTLVGFDEYGSPVQTGQTPFEKAAFQNTGGQTLALDPLTGQVRTTLQNTQTPDGAASNALGWANNAVARGGLGVSQGNLNVAQQRLQMDRDAPKGQIVQGEFGPMIVDPRSGMSRPVTGMDGQPLQAPKAAAEAALKTRDANDVASLLGQAEPLLSKATGSMLGNWYDEGMASAGKSTEGARAAAQLKAIEGAIVSKMPKMSGPQSDKDVLLYRQMAGQIGDPTVPAETKRAAMQTVREINSRYTTPAGAAPSQAAPAGVPADISNLLNKYGNR